MEQNKFYEIRNMTKHEYTLAGCDGSVITCPIQEIDKSASIFTLQDVKDGDVLAYKDEISLYKHDIKNCTKQETTFGGFVYHCCYDGKRFIMDSLYSLTEQDKMDIHSATKEQRNLLFQKMYEAGYEWDAERKELRKLSQSEVTKMDGQEQKSAWSEKDEAGLGDSLWAIQQARAIAKDENDMGNLWYAEKWLKSLKDRVGCEADCTTTKEWSEEDEAMFQGVIETEQYMLDVVYGHKIFAVGNEGIKEECTKELSWLKSLKDRIK